MLNLQIIMRWYFKSKGYMYYHHIAIRKYMYVSVPLVVYSEDSGHTLKGYFK